MSRPVGARIIAICEVLELCGSMCVREIFETMEGVELANVHKYCHRAVGLRLVTINRNMFPATFKALPGWQDRLGGAPYVAKEPAQKPKTYFRPKAMVSSVWDMGGRHE